MAQYNFDTLIDRRNTTSVKWSLYGEDVLPLWVADMDLPASPDIIAAMEARLKHPFFGYQCEDPELLEVICGWVAERYSWTITSEDIVLIPGVVSGFNWIAGTFVEQGRAVAFQTPVYFPFYRIGENNHIDQIEIPLSRNEGRYNIDFDLFEEMLSANVDMFLLCNPHNPVGRVFTRSELEKLGEICLQHQVLICSDEIHSDLVYSGHAHTSIASLSKDLENSSFTLFAPSKTFNIPGLQFSFAVCKNKEMRQKLNANRNGVIEWPNIFGTVAAKAAYQKGGDWLEGLVAYLENNRDFVKEFISEWIPGIKFTPPEGTYLAWLDCSELDLPASPHKFFLEKAKVALNEGSKFGESGMDFVRLNFAAPHSLLERALDQMEKAVRSYRM